MRRRREPVEILLVSLVSGAAVFVFSGSLVGFILVYHPVVLRISMN